MNHTEQELIRIDKKLELESIGIDPYPSATFPSNATAKDILENFTNEPAKYEQVSIAGRILSRRIMGSASFVEICDDGIKIQVYINKDTFCGIEDKSSYDRVFKKLIDIGDIVGIYGYVFTTKVGVVSIHANKLVLLSKALSPLPIVKETIEDGVKKIHDAFTDPEARYRKRYVDLLVNPHVREIFSIRNKVIRGIREALDNQGCLEVETPILQPIYGGASAKPFSTHHNALDMKLYLRISNELYLKRLIVGGYKGVYEFSKDFRNEGMSRFHNPEFTQVELYVAYKDYLWMMDFIEDTLEKTAIGIHGTTKLTVGNNTIDFKKPWKRITMFEVIKQFTNVDISNMSEEDLQQSAKQMGIAIDASVNKGKIIDEIFGAKCEPYLINPTIITDYPVEMSPLAKRHRDNPNLVERFEVICNGKEICNAFSELNDPIDQRKRFQEQTDLGKRGDLEAMVLDEDFLQALGYGMPQTAGAGIGIDRLVMIMANASSIQEVIFFPQMKSEV